MDQTNFAYGQAELTIGNVLALTDGSMRGVLSPAAVQKIRSSEQKVSGHRVAVGFGLWDQHGFWHFGQHEDL